MSKVVDSKNQLNSCLRFAFDDLLEASINLHDMQNCEDQFTLCFNALMYVHRARQAYEEVGNWDD